MSANQAPANPEQSEPALTPAQRRAASNPAAIALWVIVGSGLVYGLGQTAIKAATLFTG